MDTCVETTIRLEAKVDALSKDSVDTENILKAYELRLTALETDNAYLKGALKTVHLIGGLLVGLSIIGTVVVMIVK